VTSDIILASGSAARAQMLKNAGYEFDVMPADIDEQAIIEKSILKDKAFEEIAMSLAEQKALEGETQEKYIVGSDQLLVFENKIYSKSKNLDEARAKLSEMQGRPHQLISGLSVVKNNEVIFSDVDSAIMTMKPLDEQQIEGYLERVGEDALACVGGYAVEGVGARLFKRIDGDFFTIMGMPLIKLINFFDKEGVV
jgi:septum formation protein